MASGQGGEVRIAVEGQCAWVTFHRPQSRNALTFEMYDALESFLGSGDAAELRVVVFQGAGRAAFSAGTDIREFASLASEEDAVAYEAHVERVLSGIEALPGVTIAALSGACTGAGAAIAAACDLRVCTPSLRFGVPIASTLGNCLSVENYARLFLLLGAGRVKDLLINARLMGAEEAYRSGLVAEVVADEDSLDQRVRDLAEEIAGRAPLSLRATKEAMNRVRMAVTPPGGTDIIGMCYGSADFQEGQEAFLAKRPAKWHGM